MHFRVQREPDIRVDHDDAILGEAYTMLEAKNLIIEELIRQGLSHTEAFDEVSKNKFTENKVGELVLSTDAFEGMTFRLL